MSNKSNKEIMDEMFETLKSSIEFQSQFNKLSEEEQEQIVNSSYDNFKEIAKLVVELNNAIEKLSEYQKLNE